MIIHIVCLLSYIQGESKNASWGDVWFLNGSDIDQNKNSSFRPYGQKIPILHEKLEFWMVRDNFLLKKRGWGPMCQIDGNFLLWSKPEQKVKALRLKNHTSP